jgi:hypothetical protein
VCKNQAGAMRVSLSLNFLPETEIFSHPYFHAAACTERFGSAMPKNPHDKTHNYFTYPIEKQKARILWKKFSGGQTECAPRSR